MQIRLERVPDRHFIYWWNQRGQLGTPASALLSQAKPIWDLEKIYGARFVPISGQSAIEAQLLEAGPGSSGIVFGARKRGEVDHVFNAVNQGGEVRFLDGQTGGVAMFDLDFVSFQFMMIPRYPMIDIRTARAIAEERIHVIGKEIGKDLAIVESGTRAFEGGWVFCYNTRTFLETGEYRSSLAGNAPLIISSRDGAMCETGTALPVEVYIAEFQKSMRLNGSD